MKASGKADKVPYASGLAVRLNKLGNLLGRELKDDQRRALKVHPELRSAYLKEI